MNERRSGHTEEIAFPATSRKPDLPARLGRYEILAELGSGGMASVYLARLRGPAGFSKLFALKRVHPHLAKDPLFVDMFLDEARIAAALQHPNVALVLELGLDNGEHFIAMEYLHGEHLAAVARVAQAHGGLPIAVAAALVARAADGLHHAHEARDAMGQALGVVHRDVTPHNIFVTYEGNVKLTDFGIAKAEGRIVRTETGTVKGKFAYMAPEQALGRPIDRRVDVFALGVVLWELVAGERLFRGNTDAETLMAVALCEIGPPSARRPECPPGLDSIVLKCLARDPNARFETAQDVAAALDHLVERLGGARARDVGELMQRLFAARIEERALWLRARAEGAIVRDEEPVTHVSQKSRERALTGDATPSGTLSVNASMIIEREPSIVPLVSLRAGPSAPAERASSPTASTAGSGRSEVEAPLVLPASQRPEDAPKAWSGRTIAAIAAVAGVVAMVTVGLAVAAGVMMRSATKVSEPPARPVIVAVPPRAIPQPVAATPNEPVPAASSVDVMMPAEDPQAGATDAPPSAPSSRPNRPRATPRALAPSLDECPSGGRGSVDLVCGGGHWASVWLDGVPWRNEAPATRQRVPAGRHSFEFQIDGEGPRRGVVRCVRPDESLTIGCRE